jgi:F-type H+-transporting ATPase subunit alpha
MFDFAMNMKLRPDEISSIIGQEIAAFKTNDLKVDNVGIVLQVGDGIVRVYGLSHKLLELL